MAVRRSVLPQEDPRLSSVHSPVKFRSRARACTHTQIHADSNAHTAHTGIAQARAGQYPATPPFTDSPLQGQKELLRHAQARKCQPGSHPRKPERRV